MSRKIIQLVLLMAAISTTPLRADELETLGRLSTIVEVQCRRFYEIDTSQPVEALQNKQMSEVDKFACAYPFAYRKIVARLRSLEQLSPESEWGKQTHITLASRIYSFDYLKNTPHGDLKLEIMAIHPDLLMLDRIMRQTTPYALAFAFPKLTKGDSDLAMATRIAAAGEAELTPWSATLRLANGTDCYGPGREACQKNKLAALQTLVKAIELLKRQPNRYGYITEYERTDEYSALRSAPLIKLTSAFQKSVAGQSIDFILGLPASAGWLSVRPDLRETLDYLAADDKDIELPTTKLIDTDDLNCKTVFASLLALATESPANALRQALKPFNPMEAELKANPALANRMIDVFKLLEGRNCDAIQSLGNELKLHGLLSRFQAYQIHVILLSSHDDGLSAKELQGGSRQFVLVSDIERVIQDVLQKIAIVSIEPDPSVNPQAEKLVDYVKQLQPKGLN